MIVGVIIFRKRASTNRRCFLNIIKLAKNFFTKKIQLAQITVTFYLNLK